jgi:thiosulfate reductase cytochrome b subunit
MCEPKAKSNALPICMSANWLKYLINSLNEQAFRETFSPAGVIDETVRPLRDVALALRKRFLRLRRN